MRVEVIFSNFITIALICLLSDVVYSQTIHSGEIVFERRTNLEKRYEGSDLMGGRNRDWMKTPKIDEFVLYFNDTSALFKPIPPALEDQDREWATMKNTTYQNLEQGKMEREFNLYGTAVYLYDSLKTREWIITENRRDIAGYNTRQALWVANDSTRIYAWYAEQLTPSVGPESFNGLPGVILGLAIEDGGVVYFAKSVKPLSNKNFKELMPKGRGRSSYNSSQELFEFVNNVLSGRGGRSNAGRMLDDIFVW